MTDTTKTDGRVDCYHRRVCELVDADAFHTLPFLLQLIDHG